MSAESHDDGGNQSNNWENNPVYYPWVGSPFSVEKGLPVVSQSHSNNRKISADGEHWKEAQEVVQKGIRDYLITGEVERVHVHESPIAEAVDSSEGEEAVKAQN